jgi:hypothetical protein
MPWWQLATSSPNREQCNDSRSQQATQKLALSIISSNEIIAMDILACLLQKFYEIRENQKILDPNKIPTISLYEICCQGGLEFLLGKRKRSTSGKRIAHAASSCVAPGTRR